VLASVTFLKSSTSQEFILYLESALFCDGLDIDVLDNGLDEEQNRAS
jgi:hypothetical protein